MGFLILEEGKEALFFQSQSCKNVRSVVMYSCHAEKPVQKNTFSTGAKPRDRSTRAVQSCPRPRPNLPLPSHSRPVNIPP